jgi:hypothetical protein
VSDQDNDPLKNLAHLFNKQEAQGDKVVPLPKRDRPADAAPPPDQDGEKGKKGKKEKQPKVPRAYIELGEDCPVRPLGVNGSDYFFLDAIDQLVIKNADKLSQNGVDDLFKHSQAQRWADANFGRIGEGGVLNGIDRDLLKRALIAACGDLSIGGVFDPSGRVRGDGGWKDETGRLVFHCGDVVLTADKNGKLHEGRPGVRDQLIYPKGSRQLRPADAGDAPAGERGPAAELLQLLSSWKWKRGQLDALLQLGWITMAPIGGALRWRPSEWVTGDMATGKSTLQELIFLSQGGRPGIIQAADATGAGIWQALKFRSLPVALDEVEASTNNEKREAIINLMRISASGAMLRRGGADHHAVEFNVFAPFLFSSINMLPLPPQDVSRMALLELEELPRGQARPVLDPKRLSQIGAALRRRVIRAWARWDEHLAPWWEPIGKEFSARTADTFGFLLAMSHLALCDEPAHPDTVEETIAPLIPSLREWLAIAGKDHELALTHLGTWQLEPWDKGRKMTVRQLVHWASSRAPSGGMAPTEGVEAERFGQFVDRTRAGAALRLHGMALISSRKEGEKGTEYLAIAFRHAGLSRIFRGTKWQDGVWRQSAMRAPGAVTRKVRIEGGAEGAVLVPIEAVLGAEAGT